MGWLRHRATPARWATMQRSAYRAEFLRLGFNPLTAFLQLREDALACFGKRVQTIVTGLHTVNDALRDPLAKIVVTTAGQALANFVERHFHPSHHSPVKVFDDQLLKPPAEATRPSRFA